MSSMRAFIFSGKAENLLPGIADASADAIITDPPYGLAELPAETITKALSAWLGGDRMHVPDGKGFMGKDWDRFVPPPGIWDECYRILRPGGHMAVFAGTRTADLMGLSIRLAGFEIRDSLHWVYGQGFPKSLDVSKAIDRAAGAEREVTGTKSAGQSSLERVRRVEQGYRPNLTSCTPESIPVTAPATEAARQWNGWGTALKPAHEPILLARKLFPGTIAANVLEHGTSALNLAACKVAHASAADLAESENKNRHADFGSGPRQNSILGDMSQHDRGWQGNYDGTAGRWPANLLLIHHPDCVPARLAECKSGTGTVQVRDCVPGCPVAGLDRQGGGASRFFPQFAWDPGYDLPFLYCAKASKKERPRAEGVKLHPTIKPLALMRWLAKLLCPPGGLICDPFGGTMPVVQAALLEGFRCISADSWPDAIEHARVRLAGFPEAVFS